MVYVLPIYGIGLLAGYLSTRTVVVIFNGDSSGTYDYFFHLAPARETCCTRASRRWSSRSWSRWFIALTPSLMRFLEATPQFRDVMTALYTATGDIFTTLSAATSVSNRMVGDQRQFSSPIDGFARFTSVEELNVENPLTANGIRIGRVDSIAFAGKPDGTSRADVGIEAPLPRFLTIGFWHRFPGRHGVRLDRHRPAPVRAPVSPCRSSTGSCRSRCVTAITRC